MAELPDHPPPMVGASAHFHHDLADRLPGEEFEQLRARELPAQHRLTVRRSAVQLEVPLRDIDADDADHLVHGSPLSCPERTPCAFSSPGARWRPVGGASTPSQCETLRSGQGDAAPPLNPQLPAPLPGQRAVGAAVANRVAGALPEDHLTVMAAARTPPTRSRRPTMARRRTWTAPARAIERERSRLGQAPSGATGHGSHDGRARTPQRSAGVLRDRRGGVPRQPLPGTREAWPQRVGWLLMPNGVRSQPWFVQRIGPQRIAPQRLGPAYAFRFPTARNSAHCSISTRRRSSRSERSKRLQCKRGELNERSFAHMYETGGMRRLHLRGRRNILKRLLVHGAGFDLSLLMRMCFGAGKPRQLQGRVGPLFAALSQLGRAFRACTASTAHLYGIIAPPVGDRAPSPLTFTPSSVSS